MRSPIADIPEVRGLDNRQSLVRIPPELDVPLTTRVRALLDTPPFRRLSRISQLGLVSLVYPAAHHTRFEHSLGVYRLALLYLKQLSHDPRFRGAVSAEDAACFIAAALLHDIGHWPFCHAIEDMQLADVPRHEVFAESFLAGGEVSDVLRRQWGVEPAAVLALLGGRQPARSARILASLLSGPVDVDKMDYLPRDSLHAGVPYGRNFDQSRLIGSLCLNDAGDRLAITEKGRTAAEMMVFCRYVMFSEVYWHHAVRSATAMLQRAFYGLHGRLDLPHLFRNDEHHVVQELLRVAAGGPAHELMQGLFGPRRRLFKRLAQFSLFQQPEIYRRLARRPYPWLVRCSERLAEVISRRTPVPLRPEQVLLDAPPVKREVEIRIDVRFPKEDCYRSLADVSPVVRTLAQQQFDDYVKRVRIFVSPVVAPQLADRAAVDDWLSEAIETTAE